MSDAAEQVRAVCRPLVRNVLTPPEGSDWVRATCERCGDACWQRPATEAGARLKAPWIRFVACCTKCAMERGLVFHD